MNTGSGLSLLISKMVGLLNQLIPFLILVAVVIFIVGILRYVMAKGPEDKEKGMHVIISSIIGLTVIVSMWGLVTFLQQSFGLDAGNNTVKTYKIPCVPGASNNTSSTNCY